MMASKRKKEVRFFLSYAHENMQLATRFLNLIMQQMGPSKAYDYKIWRDEDNILPGEDWATAIDKALKTCHLGLLLISPSFLNSGFITEKELPLFVGKDAKACIPVLLCPVNFRRHDMKGLKAAQLFRLRTPRGKLKNFSECSSLQRTQFCETLFDKIETRLDNLLL